MLDWIFRETLTYAVSNWIRFRSRDVTFISAASHSFADITKCRYLRGNHSDIDFDQFDSKETLAINRNKIILRVPESESEAEEDEKIKTETNLPMRTADMISQLEIKIDAIL